MNSPLKDGAQAREWTLTRKVRLALRSLRWKPQFRRLAEFEGIGAGRRAFLVGSGPSLGAMDLTPLATEFVCIANLAIRALDLNLPRADMHVMNDTHGYVRFAREIEEAALRHAIRCRFLNIRARPTWRRFPDRPVEPIFLVPHVMKLVEAGAVPPIEEGIASGSSVLVTAAVLLHYMRFDPIYVIGCDLDYETHGPYFYAGGADDRSHGNDPLVHQRRATIWRADEQFAILREDFLRDGSSIINAGVGGNLKALPRVRFEDLFRGHPT